MSWHRGLVIIHIGTEVQAGGYGARRNTAGEVPRGPGYEKPTVLTGFLQPRKLPV